MKKIDYLKNAVQTDVYKRKAWVIALFAITQEDDNKYLEDPYPYRIVQQKTGHYFVEPNTKELVQIEDANPKEPLFSMQDPIVIDNGWIVNAFETINTSVGNLLTNLILLVSPFGRKIPFMTGRMSISKIEDYIAPKLKDTPIEDRGEPNKPVMQLTAQRSQGDIYVDEYIKFCDAVMYYSGFSQICTVTSTRKTITAAPGINEYKNKLYHEEFGGKITDPITLSKFEQKLKDYDEEYIKDDPTNGRFLSGKVKANARRKLFLAQGADKTFKEGVSVHPIINSLEEGWSKDPEDWVTAMNVVRAGSYGRGKDTQQGGVTYKAIIRAASNIIVEQTDCGTQLGLPTRLNKQLVTQLAGRYIKEGRDWKFIETEQEALAYTNKDIILRSVMYCKLEGTKVCSHCAGKYLSRSASEIPYALANISGIILSSSLAAFHAKALQVEKMDYLEAFT